jgi:hypothetical protein
MQACIDETNYNFEKVSVSKRARQASSYELVSYSAQKSFPLKGESEHFIHDSINIINCISTLKTRHVKYEIYILSPEEYNTDKTRPPRTIYA